jgi:predicted acyl esterase
MLATTGPDRTPFPAGGHFHRSSMGAVVRPAWHDPAMPRRTPLLRALLAVLVVLALAVSAESLTGSASAVAPSLTLRPGTNQFEVLGSEGDAGLELRLVRSGQVVRSGTVDAMGSLMWRQLDPGKYTVQTTDGTPVGSGRVTSMKAAPPPHSFYKSQTLDQGLGSITTRDGTTLSAYVSFPAFGDPPYPTVVEYSGYDPSRPPTASSPNAFAQLFNGIGYAYVGVNIRGTGCSGGSFLPFEPVQSLDGYDAIEAIAAQPWVKRNKVGMVGISYPGIEQLYVARTRPPHLSAITPLSVIDDSYRGTLWPGGILNTGFAEPWASQRAADAQPYGEGWEQDAVDNGADWCATNQNVRLQNPDPVALIEDNPYYNQRYYARIDPSRFVHRIDVPVYLAGAWQDEQTGGHFPAFLHKFKSSPQFFATMSNGSHTEALSLGEFGRYLDFIDFYIGHRVPLQLFKNIAGPKLAEALTGMSGLSVPPGPTYDGMTFKRAKRKFQRLKHIRVLFEEGAAKGQPSGAPLPRFAHSFTSWPPPNRHRVRWYLTPHGRLATHPVGKGRTQGKARSFRADPSALPTTDYSGSNSAIWGPHPKYHWKQIPKGTGLGWISAPMRKTQVVVGGGSLDVWVKTRAEDVDLEATVSDVRPGGREVYVQTGWLRASHRKLAKSSTVLRPVHTDLRRDAHRMPAGKYRLLRIEIPAFAQPFRKGDRLRITLDAPGGAKPLWAFRTIDHGQKVTIGAGGRHRSSLVLTTVPGIHVPPNAPRCRSLRSQPCRSYGG